VKFFTTTEAAKKAKISRQSLQAWISEGRIAAPQLELVDGKAMRRWTDAHIRDLLRIKAQTFRKKKKGGPR
jgi:DNA-binding transcriptional MerR regulator